jgi:hypothetical protein
MTRHNKNFHRKIVCKICDQEIIESNIKRHLQGHKVIRGLKSGLEQGKVKAKRIESVGEKKKEKKISGREKMRDMRLRNPSMSQKDLMKMMPEAYASEDKEAWKRRAAAKNTNNSEKLVVAEDQENDCAAVEASGGFEEQLFVSEATNWSNAKEYPCPL